MPVSRSRDRGRGRNGGAPAFDPLALASTTLLLDAAVGVTGSPASQWDSRVVAPAVSYTATGTQRPTVGAAPSRLVFDGVDDVMATSTTLASLITSARWCWTGALYVRAVSANNANPPNNHGIMVDSGGNWGVTCRSNAGVPVLAGYCFQSGAYRTVEQTAALNTWVVYQWWADGSNFFCTLNGASQTSVAEPATLSVLSSTHQLANGGTNVRAQMDLACLVLCNSDTDAATRAKLVTYVGARAGLVL